MSYPSIHAAPELDPDNVEQCRELLLPHSIWLHPAVYEVMPVLLPHLMRVRGDFSAGRRGEPNEKLYAQDENSALKGIPGLCVGASPNPLIAGYKHMGWTASHIVPTRWFAECMDYEGSVNESELYSFIPNVVWLPGAYSHYTDFQSRRNHRREELPLFNVYLTRFSQFLYERHVQESNDHYEHCKLLWAIMASYELTSDTKLQHCDPGQWQEWHLQDEKRITFFDTSRFFGEYIRMQHRVPPAILQLLDEVRDFAAVLDSHGNWNPTTTSDTRKTIVRFAKGVFDKCYKRSGAFCRNVTINAHSQAAATACANRLRQYHRRCRDNFARVQREIQPAIKRSRK